MDGKWTLGRLRIELVGVAGVGSVCGEGPGPLREEAGPALPPLSVRAIAHNVSRAGILFQK